MSTIVTRSGKGSALTHSEMDANFTNLNTDKIQSDSTGVTFTGTFTFSNTQTFNGAVNFTSTFQLGGVTVSATAANLNWLASVTAGTVAASKAVVVDASKNIGTFGTVTAATFVGALTGNASSATTATTAGSITGQGALATLNFITSSYFDYATDPSLGWHYLEVASTVDYTAATTTTTYRSLSAASSVYPMPMKIYIPAGVTNMYIGGYGESYDLNIATTLRMYNATLAGGPEVTFTQKSLGYLWKEGTGTDVSALAGTLAEFTPQIKLASGSYNANMPCYIFYYYFD